MLSICYGPQWRESVFSVLWATVGGLRLPGKLVSLQETAAGLVAVSYGDRWNDLVWLVFLNCYEIKLLYVIHPTEYPESEIYLLLLIWQDV